MINTNQEWVWELVEHLAGFGDLDFWDGEMDNWERLGRCEIYDAILSMELSFVRVRDYESDAIIRITVIPSEGSDCLADIAYNPKVEHLAVLIEETWDAIVSRNGDL